MNFDEPLTDIENLESVETEVLVINPEFTVYTFVIRYVFLGLSVIGCAIYAFRFCKIPALERIPEQKLVLALSVLLIWFNDPFYIITVMFPNKASSYFSVFFVVNFVIFLIMFWIYFLSRILHEDGEKQSHILNWKHYAYIFLLYILTLVLYTEYAIDNIEDIPIVPAQDLFSTRFVVLEVFVIMLVLAGFIYIIVLYFRICVRVDEKMWRNQLFMFFSVFFIAVTLVMFFINGFRINSYTGNRILLLYTQMNMYVFYMQYMYSLTSEESERIDKGQVGAVYQRNDNFGLLQDAECIDLEFDDMITLSKNVKRAR